MVVMWLAFGPYPKAAALRCQSREQRFFGVYSCCEKIKALRRTQWVIFDVPLFHCPVPGYSVKGPINSTR
jgi:hypothetical protein